jgi:hypothetical protein
MFRVFATPHPTLTGSLPRGEKYSYYILRVITIIMIEHQFYNIAVDTELDFTYFANNKHNNNKLIL